MTEIICQGKSLGETKTKCIVTEILLKEKSISTDTATKVLSAIGGIYVHNIEREE